MNELVSRIKSLVYIFGFLSSITATVVLYFHDYHDILLNHTVDIILLCLILSTSGLLWYTLRSKHDLTSTRIANIEKSIDFSFLEIKQDMLRGEIDRFYRNHKDQDTLSEDEAKYLYMLKEKLTEYQVNSFSERKVDILLSKPIV